MTRDKIITEITQDSFYMERCKHYTKGGDTYQDLYQFIMLSLLEMPEERLVSIYKVNMKGYINRMIWINATSKTAPFYRQYRYSDYVDVQKSSHVSDVPSSSYNYYSGGDYFIELKLQEMNSEVDDLDILERIKDILAKESQKWLNKGKFPCNVTMLELYSELGSMRELARKTEIPYSTIRYNIDTLIKKINEDLNSNK